MDPLELIKICGTNRAFTKVCNDEKFWKYLIRTNFPDANIPEMSGTDNPTVNDLKIVYYTLYRNRIDKDLENLGIALDENPELAELEIQIKKLKARKDAILDKYNAERDELRELDAKLFAEITFLSYKPFTVITVVDPELVKLISENVPRVEDYLDVEVDPNQLILITSKPDTPPEAVIFVYGKQDDLKFSTSMVPNLPHMFERIAARIGVPAGFILKRLGIDPAIFNKKTFPPALLHGRRAPRKMATRYDEESEEE